VGLADTGANASERGAVIDCLPREDGKFTEGLALNGSLID